MNAPRIAAVSILGLGGIATYAVNYPGSMEYDSFVQLLEGRNGSYTFWHPPVMSWMLGVADTLIGPASAWFMLFDMVLAFGALISLLWLARRVAWPVAAAAVFVLFLPQLFLQQAAVIKDTLFADACLAGFICLAHAAERWPLRRLRFALLGASAVFLALAALTRQNGAVVVPCAAAGLAFIAARQESGWRPGAAYGAGLLAAVAVLALAANTALALRWDGSPSRENQIKILQLYDLTGMAKRNPAVLGIVESRSPGLARVIAGEGVRLWSPLKNDTLEVPPIVPVLDETPAPVLRHIWLEAAVRYPGTYLAVRTILFRWVFQPPDVGECNPFYVGEEGDPDDLKTLGLQSRLDARDHYLLRYGDAFVGTPAYSHGVFSLLGMIVLVVTLRRRRPADLAIASMIAAAFVFAATFFVISIACDYRYLYVIDLTALAGALYLAADWDFRIGLVRHSQ